MPNCEHLNFHCQAEINRITHDDPNVVVAYTVDIRICCRDCGQQFEFIGLPNGMSFYQPTVSIAGDQARLPIVIPGTMPPPGLAGFSVTYHFVEEKEGKTQ